MPDISMCTNRSCPSRGRCYRYLARPSELGQAYGLFEPGEKQCNHFWRVRPAHGVRNLAEADRQNAEAERQHV